MDGRQSVPRAEKTAVIRDLLHVQATGHGITEVTIWSDSKVVVQGFNKGKAHTLQSMLVTDWEDLWAQVDALRARNVPVRIKK
eukprot:10968319-Karenia_brevis.AAC.1